MKKVVIKWLLVYFIFYAKKLHEYIKRQKILYTSERINSMTIQNIIRKLSYADYVDLVDFTTSPLILRFPLFLDYVLGGGGSNPSGPFPYKERAGHF